MIYSCEMSKHRRHPLGNVVHSSSITRNATVDNEFTSANSFQTMVANNESATLQYPSSAAVSTPVHHTIISVHDERVGPVGEMKVDAQFLALKELPQMPQLPRARHQ